MHHLHIDIRATQPVDLALQMQVAPGELVALVGASGSGKTSVLRAIAGLWPRGQLQGQVHCGPRVWLDTARAICLPPQQRQVGLVFQHYALFPHLSVLQNVTLAAGPQWPAGHVQQMLERMGLDAVLHRRPAQLSGGQQQRVALARALVRILPNARQAAAPHGALLLDEPFSAIDAPTRHLLYRELAMWREQVSAPIVLVTHDLQEARQLADRVLILDAGRSLQTGPPDKVFAQPRTARVAELVGIRNCFTGEFQTHRSGNGQLLWRGTQGTVTLQVPDKQHIAHGAQVHWVINGESIDVWPDAPPAEPHTTNVLACTWGQLLSLGDISWCQLHPNTMPEHTIALRLSTRLLRQWRAQTGAAVHLQLHPQALHIMPPCAPADQRQSPSAAA